MRPRERIVAALSPGGSPECPVVIPYEGIYVRDHWEQLTGYPWWYARSPRIDHQLAWRRDAYAATGQDWFDLPLGLSRPERQALAVECAGDEADLVEGRTGERRRLQRPRIGGWNPSGALESVHRDSPPLTPDEIDHAMPLPDAGEAERAVADGRGDLAMALLRAHGQDLYPIRSVSAPLWSAYNLWGFEGLMTLIADRPELVAHACRRSLEAGLASVRLSAAVGAAGIWIEDCMSDMIAPHTFRRLNTAYVAQLVEAIRGEGMASIYYFCGDPAGKWDALLDVGADALSLEESKKGFRIDIEKVVDRVAGRCAVLGNLDAIHLLERGSEAELRAEVARQIGAGRRNGGRFIMSLGSPVTPGAPVARVRRYCDLVRELGGGEG